MTGSPGSSLPSAAAGRLRSRPAGSHAARPPGTHVLDLGHGIEALLTAPPATHGPAPLLVFFHGAGASAERSLAAVGDTAARHGVAVLAPTSVATTWDLLSGGLGRDVAVLDAALEQVFTGQAVSRVAFGGFSDGASYAISLGLANGELAEAVLGFSPGFAAPPRREGRPRVWISHGRADRVLPVDRCGRRVAAQLRTGYDVTYEEFDDGHVMPPHLVEAALDWWLAGPGH
jgi:phospholipase/carboxylesterase